MFWFRPVGDLSYTLDYQLWGLNATGYHVHGLVLHALVVLVLVWLIREWPDLRGDRLPARPVSVWLIALAFTLNPIAALTVTRPSMRYDLYATLLVLISLLALCRWQRRVWPSGRTLALGAAFAAFASKESAVVQLPLLFLLSDGGLMRRLRALWPFVASFGLYVGWRILVIKGLGGYPWLSGSWEDVFRPDRYMVAAVTMARDGWGTSWVLAALLAVLLAGLLARPTRAVVAMLAFLSTLAPWTLFPRFDELVPTSHYLYLPLAVFSLSLGAGCAGLERWRPGRVIAPLCLLGLTWQGFEGIRPLCERETRTGQKAQAIVASLTRLPRPPGGPSHYFLFDGSGLAQLMALISNTRQEAWNIVHPAAARVSPGLAAKADAGAARIFSYDGTAWTDTTRDTVEAIRANLAAPKDPPPTVTLTADGYRLHVRLAAAPTISGRLLRLYYGPVTDPEIYHGLLHIAAARTTLSVPPGTYAVTSTLVAADARASAPAPRVHLTIPARH